MKSVLLALCKPAKALFQNVLKAKTKSSLYAVLFFMGLGTLNFQQAHAQGAWSAVAAPAPHPSGGGMLLLSDGSVICKSFSGGTDTYGTIYDKLTPDSHGSYANGTWTSIAPMFNSRLYYSSQVLKDGRVYVAGGEYGTGGSSGETYNPLTNTWTMCPSPNARISDANSEILDDGTVLQALVTGTLRGTDFYHPTTNTYTTGPSCLGIHNESVWVKLPDNSILFVDRGTTTSERYIPSMNQWVKDANAPVALYDPYGLESGAALLLPDGRAFFLSSLGYSAYYTPSGTSAPGTWTTGPSLPNNYGQPDAPAAMMVNGKILLDASPKPTSANHFPSPTYFFEFDYKTNTFTQINAPTGTASINEPAYVTTMMDLPNGTVLYATQRSNQYYIYTPDGTPVSSGKPVIKSGKKASGASFLVTGTGFNGISEGASYGDDWQMNTNYPLVRLQSGTNVYYARTFNWNHTGVQTGNLLDSVYVTLPAGLPAAKYAVSVVANGISSNPVTVRLGSEPFADAIVNAINSSSEDALSVSKVAENGLKVYPNPAKTQTNIQFGLTSSTHVSIKLVDMSGKVLASIQDADLAQGSHSIQFNTSKFTAGAYMVRMVTSNGTQNAKLIIQ